ncbi:MAG: IscS subfamily cysteine desulfurase [Alphaproteobacteria bacterium]|nr:MAG: IscS subfamily cysteine desulfurase [Alphaproteobacteria bacterium]TAF76987.1 MAG: IscS subfamily cysteine desulfurase [Alphaproteobacteria bacterium]
MMLNSPAHYPIYMDYQSTTPVDPRVMNAMMPYFATKFGNPHSRNHLYGWDAEAGVEQARQDVARLIGASDKEIIFTSGATESNNIAIKGIAHFFREKKDHIVTLNTEHRCVLESCRALEREGFRVTYVPVERDGLVDVDRIKHAITDRTALVSVMMVHNEIGVIQPIEKIGALCRDRGVFFHTDAAQAFGKIPIHVDEMNIDIMSISGHKIYAPKGIGALYVRRRPRVRLEPLLHGGGQERGMRSGTLPVPLVVALGKSAEIAMHDMREEHDRIARLSHRFFAGVLSHVPQATLNGHPTKRWVGNISIRFPIKEGASLMLALKDLAISSGSACSSATMEPSYTLQALGAAEDQTHTTIRFGIGRFTTEEEIDQAITYVAEAFEMISVQEATAKRGILQHQGV